MDEQPDSHDNHANSRRRGGRLVTALLAVGVLAAVPAGVALAGGSDGSSVTSATPAQSSAPGDREQGRGDGDRGDCPDKDRRGGEESTQL